MEDSRLTPEWITLKTAVVSLEPNFVVSGTRPRFTRVEDTFGLAALISGGMGNDNQETRFKLGSHCLPPGSSIGRRRMLDM
jgi:hypothetical protein